MADRSVEDAIVVVGVCGAGKSTLVKALRALGYRARECVQEHSYVPTLWRRHGRPCVLIYLDASAETVSCRLGVRWDERVLEAERERLALARANCDLYLETDGLTAEEVRRAVLCFLEGHRPTGVGSP